MRFDVPIRAIRLLLPVFGLALASETARAQCTSSLSTTTTTSITSSGGTVPLTWTTPWSAAQLDPSTCLIQFSLADCQASTSAPNLSFSWSLPSGMTTVTSQEVFLSSSSSCASNITEEDAADLVYWDVPSSSQIMNNGTDYDYMGDLTVQDLFSFAQQQPTNNPGVLTPACPATFTGTPVYICVALPDSASTTVPYGYLEVTLYSEPPPAPSAVTVSPLNEGLDVQWTMPSNTSFPLNFQVVATDPNQVVRKGTVLAQLSTTSNDYKLLGLTNGVTYTVVVNTLDNSGWQPDYIDANVTSSAAQTGEPQPIVDLLQNYVNEGGEGQGCSSGGASLSALLGLFARFRRVRARRDQR